MIDQHQQVSGGAGYAGGFAVGGGQFRQNAQTSGARPDRPFPTVMAGQRIIGLASGSFARLSHTPLMIWALPSGTLSPQQASRNRSA